MSSFWATDDGWPYADPEGAELVLEGGEADDDLLSLATCTHLYDGLDATEREVLTSRFGLGGEEVRTMKELQRSTGLERAQLRSALGSGLAKIRHNLEA